MEETVTREEIMEDVEIDSVTLCRDFLILLKKDLVLNATKLCAGISKADLDQQWSKTYYAGELVDISNPESVTEGNICKVQMQLEFFVNPNLFYSFPFGRSASVCEFLVDENQKKIISVKISDCVKIQGRRPKYIMREKNPLHLRSVLEFKIKKGEHIKLFFPAPPTCQQQRNITCKVLDEGVDVVQVGTVEGVSLLYSTEIRADKMKFFENSTKFRVEFEWDFCQRFLDERGAHEGDSFEYQPSVQERELFLKDDEYKYNFKDQRFKEWMTRFDLWKTETDDEISLGYRALSALRNITYTAENEFRGCEPGGVAAAVVLGKTDCGGKALIFSATMRANGIPARLMQGQLCDIMPEVNHNADVTQHEFSLGLHAMAEFYTHGIGWVPVETTDRGLVTFGRDRKSHPFLVKHFDFIYNLEVRFPPDNKAKILHPIFMPTFYPVVFESKEKLRGHLFERQEWHPKDHSVVATTMAHQGEAINELEEPKSSCIPEEDNIIRKIGGPGNTSWLLLMKLIYEGYIFKGKTFTIADATPTQAWRDLVRYYQEKFTAERDQCYVIETEEDLKKYLNRFNDPRK